MCSTFDVEILLSNFLRYESFTVLLSDYKTCYIKIVNARRFLLIIRIWTNKQSHG